MKSHPTFIEAERLHKLGFSIHWLHAKSKRPIGFEWASKPRRNWRELAGTFKSSFNVGVRPGATSKISEQKYLACIDVDIKDPKYRSLAEEALKKIVGNLRCPEVRSGSGNGSRHLYCVTAEPFPMITAVRHDGWEICVYSDGRQMVLPPSIHPSGRPYVWKVPLLERDDLPLIKFKRPEKIQGSKLKEKAQPTEIKQFVFQNVEWKSVASENFRILIEEGKWNGSEVNKSDYLPLAATYLLENNFDESQVASILTDPKNELGRVSYRHAGNTASQEVAAQWLWKYTLKKAIAEYTWKKKLNRRGKKGNGPPISSIENVVLVIQNDVAPDVFRHDLFAARDSHGVDTPWRGKKDAPITDGDVARIRLWLGRKFQFEPSKEIVGDAITNVAHENAFDPITEWLDALPAWDGVQRLNGWLATNFEAKGDPLYLAQVFRKWMVGMVKRQYVPGTKFDWMPIFEGPQGIGKSSFGRLLVGEKYFLDWLPNLGDKDAAQALQGIWAVELGELATLRRNELEVVKGYITRTVDKFRPPYGKRMIESPRRCVFYGTTNREKYLRDETGNRRFKPVLVGNLNFEALSRDREQLFAEAKYFFEKFYRSNKSLELTGRAKAVESEIQADKMIEDESSVMYELIKDHLSQLKGDSEKRSADLKMYDLFFPPGPLYSYQPDQRNIQFAGKALTLLGFENKKINGNRVWRLR
jgi:hypothetical protein